jgi:enamine deaminase RidA (YjgF/YER057c/UK114 family)
VNPAGAALTAAAWALKPRAANGPALHATVASPLQGPAPAYGSAFSRAVEVQGAGYRQLVISGTASITPDGRTAHVGDVPKQIELTMQVVAELLRSRQMTFADVTRATAYFKSPADAPAFAAWLQRHDLATLPVVSACCAICRDDLLFEIELDAVRVESV